MNRTFFIVLLIVVLAGSAVAAYFGYKHYHRGSIASTSTQRQAVFLTNGQVYFGYVSDPANQIVTLKNIYYLKTVDAGSSEDTNVVDATGNNKVILVKFGNEVHGPDDLMRINRDQVLFYEDMKSDSKINQMIKEMGG